MTITDFMTSCIYVITNVFEGYPLLKSILALAIMCACIYIVKSFFGGNR